MRRSIPSSKLVLFGYFALLMITGGLLLWALPTWAAGGRVPFVDAMFTAVSAVAVTGLITVNTAGYSPLGQTIILVLIQLGGLGVIAFTTLYLTQPRKRLSLQRRAFVREYFIGSVEYDPRAIVRNIIILTATFEFALAIVLVLGFRRAGVDRPAFTALFHAVSAFCNAGFSVFPDSLERFVATPSITVPIMFGLVLGGLGFVVYQDIFRRVGPRNLSTRRHILSLHTKIVLAATGTAILLGLVLFSLFEWNGALADLTPGQRILAALFQSVTPRTAGFNTIPQSDLSLPSVTLTSLFMFIGGAPGSIAGGVKVTTFFIIIWFAFGGADENGDARVFRRKLPAPVVARATIFVIKALTIVVASILLLSITESLIAGQVFSFKEIVFEVVSAFGTVGLSLGITAELSGLGKLVIMFTMFAGRVGLISLAFPRVGRQWKNLVDYPPGEVLIG
jgi:trk/ktr system potassium uptake protein